MMATCNGRNMLQLATQFIRDVLWGQWLEFYIFVWHNGDVSSKKSAAISHVGFTEANTMLTLNRWLLNRKINTNKYSGPIYIIVMKNTLLCFSCLKFRKMLIFR